MRSDYLNKAMLRLLLLTSFLLADIYCAQEEPDSGPVFIFEPPSNVLIQNQKGALISCSAYGKPAPAMDWLKSDGTPVQDVPGLLKIYANNSLHFSSFQGPLVSSIHRASYRCAASNSVGKVISRSVTVKTVISEDYSEYDVYTRDVWVMKGNTAVFDCDIEPSFVRPYVDILSWQSGGVNVINDERHSLYGSTLQLHSVRDEDDGKQFRCVTLNLLQPNLRKSSRNAILHIINLVQTSPTIDYKQDSVTVKAGQDVVLPCVAHAFPIARYQWTKDQHNITFSPQLAISYGNLKISGATAGDSGMYSCRASNVHGSNYISTRLLVTESMMAQIDPRVQEVDAGLPATLNCSVRGSPVQQLLWYRDGLPLQFGVNIRRVSNTVIRIESVSRRDVGMYQCLVSNSKENVQGTAQLELGVSKPIFHGTMESQYKSPGAKVSFKCAVYGNPAPNITWTVSDQPIPAGDSRYQVGTYMTPEGDIISHVNISTVIVMDGGLFKCQAENKIGVAAVQGHLYVYGIPYVRKLDNITAVTNKTLELKCHVAGYPVPSIVWSKGDTIVRRDHRHQLNDDGLLTIFPVEEADRGWYTCTAKNNDNHGSNASLYVNVITQPVLMPLEFPDLTQGQQFVAVCQVRGGDRPITLQWFKNGRVISQSDHPRLIVKTDPPYMSALTLPNVNPSDAGNYTCVASNRAGVVNVTGQLNTINVMPYWRKQPEDTSVILGSSVILPCQGSGSPKPASIWKKAQDDLDTELFTEVKSSNSSHYEVFSNGSLLVHEAREIDHGHFMCHVDNGVGPGISHSLLLTVHVPASFEERVVEEGAHVGENITLVCDSKGDGPPDIAWNFKAHGSQDFSQLNWRESNRLSITSSTYDNGRREVLSISSVLRSDTGEYMCLSKNDYGYSNRVIRLSAREAPHDLQYITVSKITSRSVLLSWSAPDDGNSPITEYIIDYLPLSEPWGDNIPSKTTDRMTVLVDNLHPAYTYKLRVTAKNSVGISLPSYEVIATLLEERPSGPPVDVSVIPTTSTSIKVAWDVPGQSNLNGELKGFEINYRRVNVTTPYTTVQVPVASKKEYLLQNLNRNTSYFVAVAAYNIKGVGPKSSPIVAVTLEDVPSEPPGNVTAALEGTSIHVRWAKPQLKYLYGGIKGYKVLCTPVYQNQDESEQIVLETDHTEVWVNQLAVFRNYSIQVLAYTSNGEGVRSDHVYISTPPSVPGAPSQIAVSVINSSSVLVSWLPPKSSNGVIQQYRLCQYSGPLIIKNYTVTYPKLRQQITVTGLSQGQPYSFKVQAKNFQTMYGPFTREVIIAPTAKAAPQFALTQTDTHAAWHSDVLFACDAVGNPMPTISWSRGSVKSLPEHHTIHENGSLLLENVIMIDADEYTCTATNNQGTKQLTHTLNIKDSRNMMIRPDPPSLKVAVQTSSTIQLNWISGKNGGFPVTGWSMELKKNGKWEPFSLPADQRSFWAEELGCGRSYDFRMRAKNKEMSSVYSDEIQVRTIGSQPVMPNPDLFIQTVNRTSVELDLASWGNGGCLITYYSVEYGKVGSEQSVLESPISSAQASLMIDDLDPASWYDIKVTAHNSAGRKNLQTSFSTLTQEGYTIAPLRQIVNNDDGQIPNLSLLIPLCLTALVVLMAAVGCWFVMKRRRDAIRYKEGKPRHSIYSETSINDLDTHTHHGSRTPYNIARENVSGDSRVWLLHRQQSGLTTSDNMVNKEAQQRKPLPVTPYATFMYVPNPGDYEDCTPTMTSDGRKTTRFVLPNADVHCVDHDSDEECSCEEFEEIADIEEDEIAVEKRKIKQYEMLFGVCNDEFPPPPPELMDEYGVDTLSSKTRRCASQEHVSGVCWATGSRPNTTGLYAVDLPPQKRISQYPSFVSSMATVSSNQEELLQAYHNSKVNPPGPIQYETPHPITSSVTPESSDVTEPGIRLFTQSPPRPEETRQAVCEVPLYSCHGRSADISSDTTTDHEPHKLPRHKSPQRKIHRRKKGCAGRRPNRVHSRASRPKSQVSEVSTNSDDHCAVPFNPNSLSTSEGYGSRNKDSLNYTDASSRASSKHRRACAVKEVDEDQDESERTCLVAAGAQTGEATPPGQMTPPQEEETKLLDRYYRTVADGVNSKSAASYTDDYTIV